MYNYEVKTEIANVKDLPVIYRNKGFLDTNIRANSQEDLFVKLDELASKIATRLGEWLDGDTTYGMLCYCVAQHHRKSMERRIYLDYRGGGIHSRSQVLTLKAKRVD